MSATEPGTREIAHRVFAIEFADATHSFQESDEERAPKYVLLPTGVAVNRVFVVGTVTEVERVNDETIRARIADPTSTFVVYASQYQPDARARLEDLTPPAFVALTGKARTFQPEESEQIFTSIRPESVVEVERETRDRWIVETASQTIRRLGEVAAAKQTNTGSGAVIRAIETYDPTPAYLSSLHSLAVDCLRLTTGELESVDSRSLNISDAEDPTIPLEDLIRSGQSVRTVLTEEADQETGLEREPPQSTPVEDSASSPTESQSSAPQPEEDPGLDKQPSTEPIDPDGEFDEEEPVLSESERAAVEEEYGTEFQTGNAIDRDPDKEESSGKKPEFEESVEDPPEASEDVVDELVSLLGDLDEGEGVAREQLVSAAQKELNMEAPDVDEVLQEALLKGRCYQAGAGYRPI